MLYFIYMSQAIPICHHSTCRYAYMHHHMSYDQILSQLKHGTFVDTICGNLTNKFNMFKDSQVNSNKLSTRSRT